MTLCSLVALCLFGTTLADQVAVPTECLAVVMSDPNGPSRVQSFMNDVQEQEEVAKCTQTNSLPLAGDMVQSGKCSQEDLSGTGPPCDNAECIRAIKDAVADVIDQCLPDSKYPVMNPFMKCVLNHADDDCNRGVAIELMQPVSLIKSAGDSAIDHITRHSQQGYTFSTVVFVGVAGAMVGASAMAAVAKYAFGIHEKREPVIGSENQEPLLIE